MFNTDLNIELIEAYITGDVNAQQALFVEKMIATDEVWRDVYEGLSFADEQHISIDSSLKGLEQRVHQQPVKAVKPETKVIQLNDWKRFATMAAAMAGIIVVGYSALKLAQPYAPVNGEYAMESSSTIDEKNDAIRIIEPEKRPLIQNKSFNETEIRVRSKKVSDQPLALEENSYADISLNQAKESIKPLKSADLPSGFKLATKPLIKAENIQLVQLPTNDNVSSYANLLAYHNYREVHHNVNPTLLNSTRGANNRDNEKVYRIKEHANKDLASYFEDQEANYIARFPFNGVVKVEFTIDKEGKWSNYKVVESPNEDMTDVTLKMLRKTPWSVAKDERGAKVNETLMANVQFGNTISIKIIPVL